MQVMDLYNILEKVESKDQISSLVRSLRTDEAIWSFLTQATDVQNGQIGSIAKEKKLNPGTLGLLAFNPDLISDEYPDCRLQVSTLEDCMVYYEFFLQQHNPPASLEEAAKLAIGLVEKKKISPAWSKTFLEIVNRMHISDSKSLVGLWGTIFVIAINLIKEPDGFLADLLKLQTVFQGINLLIHSLLSLPISDENKAEKLHAITAEQSLDVAEMILNYLISINEKGLAELTAKLCVAKYLPAVDSKEEQEELLDSPDEVLQKSMFYKQIASLAQIAGETDFSFAMVAKSICLLDTISNGMKVQILSLLQQTNRKYDYEETLKNFRLDELSDRALLQEAASVGYLPTRGDGKTLDQSPFVILQEARNLQKAGNGELAKLECEKAYGSVDEGQIDQLVNFQPRFNPNWNAAEVVSSLLDMGATREAVKTAKKLLEKNPSSLSVNRITAEAYLEAQQYSNALPLLELLSLSGADSAEVERTLADCYKQVGNPQACYKIRKKLVDQEKPEIQDLLAFADAAVAVGLPEEVFNATSRVIQQEPENIGALSINGKAYALTGNRELAAEYFSKAIEMGTDDPSPWLGLVDLNLRDDDFRKGIETLRSALSALPENIEIKRKLAELLMDTGSATEALPLLNELAASTKEMQVRVLQAEAMKTLGLSEYKELVDKLYEQYPENLEIAQAHATELIKQGKRTEAKQVLESQIEQPKPGEQAVLTYADAVVGMDYEHSGEPKTLSANEYKKVKNIIDTCLEQDSDNTRAQLLQAELFENKSMHEQAFEVYSKLLEKQNSIDKSFMERIQAGFASSASFMGKFEMALAAIKQAVEARPEWVGLRKVLANVYAMAGEITDALAQAETVLNIGPQIMDSILWFVDFLGGLGKNNEAETKLREVVAEHPDNLQLQTRLAELLIKNGKQSEAKEIVLAVLPGISAALPDEELVKAAEVFAQTGDTASALVCLEYRINKSGSLSSQLDLAGYLYRQEQYTKALDELERIDAHNDSVCLVGCLKADTLVKTGELEKALELLQSISTEVNFNALDEPLHFAPQQWNELIGLKNPRLELQTGIAFKLGKLQTSQALAKKWLELEPENAEAWVALLESEQGSGEVSNELLHLSVPNDSITDGFTASLVALKIDTLLESDQAIEAQQLFEKFNSTGNYSVKSTGIRLSVLAGHLAEAETMLDELMSSRKQIEDEEELLKIGTVRNLVKSAVTLQRWNEALSLSSEMATNYSWNSACALQYLIVLVRAKEFENTAKSLSIETHNPSNFLQQIKMEEEINWLAGLLDGKNEEEVKRWILRGKMVAEPVTENIKAFALVTPKSDDVAAMVAALHNNMQDSTALQVAKKFPTNANVLFELARIQAETEPAAAVETLNTLINNEPLMPAALALRSILLEKTGKLDLAINDFEQAISDWPNEIKWRLTVAEMWQRYGNNPNAIHQLQSAHTIKPEDVMVALALGKASIDAGDFDQAVEVLQPVTTQHPNEYEAWETLSEAHSGRDDMEQALAAAKKASEINPFSTKPYLMSGKIHLEHGNLDKALEQAKQAVSQNKKDADAILFLAKVLHQQGEERQALAALEMTNQCEDATVQNMIEHVNLVKEINGGAYAKELISSLSNKYPENVELLKMLASTQAENGDTNDAEETAKRALQVDPDEPDLHLFLGKINAETGQLDQAIHHLSQGIHKKTDQMDGYLMLSKVYEQQREFTKALDALKQAMEVSPTDTRSYVAAANLYRNSKDYSNAEMVLQKAVEIDPRDVAIRRQLGALLALKLVHHSQEAGSQS